jgi:hypothetical protein
MTSSHVHPTWLYLDSLLFAPPTSPFTSQFNGLGISSLGSEGYPGHWQYPEVVGYGDTISMESQLDSFPLPHLFSDLGLVCPSWPGEKRVSVAGLKGWDSTSTTTIFHDEQQQQHQQQQPSSSASASLYPIRDGSSSSPPFYQNHNHHLPIGEFQGGNDNIIVDGDYSCPLCFPLLPPSPTVSDTGCNWIYSLPLDVDVGGYWCDTTTSGFVDAGVWNNWL